uniref:N-acetylneuraminate lyase-like isoform X1 n=2 Tax=Myxine glutinosa TaxID=7769 RepID=UPI00358E9557
MSHLVGQRYHSVSFRLFCVTDALVDFIQAVSLEAGSLPIIYYHIPVLSHLPFLASTILEAIGDKIPNFTGFKFSDMNLFDASLCMHKPGKRCSLYYGCDEQLLPGMLMGAQAAIGSTYNYFGSKNIEMLSLLQNGKLQDALNLQISLQKRISTISKTGITLPENKVVMSYISGLDMGSPRSPLTTCSASRISQLHTAIDSFQSV